MGLEYALTEEIRFRNNQILDSNFDSYEIPRFSWVPGIESVLVENSELPPKGGGEAAIVCMGGVLATAVFDATGAKLLQLPMTPDRVKEALKDASSAVWSDPCSGILTGSVLRVLNLPH